jgi:DNA uptake protein ComE-like DNA-binding protein
MQSGAHEECLSLVKDALDAIQGGKPGSTSLAVRKLELASDLIDDKKLKKWCRFQLGGYAAKLPYPKDVDEDYVNNLFKVIKEIELSVTTDELNTRLTEAGGAFKSIEFIENVLARLNRERSGNDKTYYRNNLQDTVASTSNAAYSWSKKLYKTLSFGEIPSRQFNVIRDRVDSLLLDTCPEAIEKFMSAYERLSSSSSEDWSQALTAARRVIKSVADTIYPPRDTTKGDRKLGEEQYINRLWAFLDEHAISGSDKDMAKAHVNYLGSFLQRLNDKASKGVHADVSYNEAVKAVLYTYLTLGDILDLAGDSLEHRAREEGRVNLNSATLEELKNVPGISDDLAKEIIKRRVKKKFTKISELKEFKGVGPKSIEKISEKCVIF